MIKRFFHFYNGIGEAFIPKGIDAFVSNITALYANRTYYVSAYATNSAGTAYGPEKVLTTNTPTTLYIGQKYAGGIVFYVDGSGEHAYPHQYLGRA